MRFIEMHTQRAGELRREQAARLEPWLCSLAEDRPSCLSEQSKSDYRPPCTPRSAAAPEHAAVHGASQPGTPMGDHFQVAQAVHTERMAQMLLMMT